MTFDLDTALKDSFYMIASFAESGDIIYKNNKFNMYFPDVKSKDDFMDITYEQEVFGRNRKRIIVESPDMDGIIKFEVNYSKGISSYIGTKINYDEIIELGHYTGIPVKKDKARHNSKISVSKTKMNAYATILVGKDEKIKYITDNIYEILGSNIYLDKTLTEVFGNDIALEIKNRINYLRVFDDTTLEIDGKLIVLSEMNSKYLVVNIYPYSANVMNKFEEVSYLRYKIKNLESEISSRDKFIKAQKEVYKNISTVDSLTKLYTRRYLIDRYNEALNKSKNYGYKFSLINFHIENFKKINSDIGYDKADDLLKKLSMLIRKTMDHKHDLAFRVSSAEFVILSSFTTKELAKDKYELIRNQFQEQTGFELKMRIIDSEDEVAMSENTALTNIEE
ncbi:GGDEF domain-containing protein [Acetoanaerobium noterae]|uniref:GGDEF domain-containing protein n=1 Tax=Acetoanaerobium noterae TaxID=745369 RepID=UPI0028A72F8C|nr:GGDEF domain-containing protein [Acetoanaerobium noterae]